MATARQRQQQLKWQRDNKERHTQHVKNCHQKQIAENPKKYYMGKIFRERRRTSLNNNIPFNISLEYVSNLPCLTCPVFNYPLTWGGGVRQHSTASLDKIIPHLGYIEGNVQWISWRANCLKRDGTVDEFRKLVTWLENV